MMKLGVGSLRLFLYTVLTSVFLLKDYVVKRMLNRVSKVCTHYL